MLTSQVVALATAVAMAVSGTVILLVLRLHRKTLPRKSPFRPCITSSSSSSGAEEVHDGGTRSRGEKQSSSITNRRKKNKRVRFADGVADPAGYNKTKNNSSRSRPNSSSSSTTTTTTSSADKVNRRMPENRMALYNGILRDRIIHRVAYSY